MRLRERDPDPQVTRELEALDSALRGEPVDPGLAELAELSRELREARPQIRGDFATELDVSAAEGFHSAPEPRPEASPLRHRVGRTRRSPMTLAFGAASVLLALVIGIGVVSTIRENGTLLGGSAEEISSGGDDSAAIESAEPGAGPTSAGDASTPLTAPTDSIPPAGRGERQLKPVQDRIQEKTVSTTLSTEPGEVDDVADGVVEVTERYDGIVATSNVSTNADRGRANFDLRIPTQNLQAFLADLSDLASVSERNEGVLDITAPFISAEERFDDAKAEVEALLAQLAEADSTTEIDAIKQRLAPARAELAAARAALADLKRRADYSTVAVSVVGDGDSDGWSIGDAADDAVGVFEDIVGAGLVTLAVIIPLGVVAVFGGLGLRQFRRHQRESALDD